MQILAIISCGSQGSAYTTWLILMIWLHKELGWESTGTLLTLLSRNIPVWTSGVLSRYLVTILNGYSVLLVYRYNGIFRCRFTKLVSWWTRCKITIYWIKDDFGIHLYRQSISVSLTWHVNPWYLGLHHLYLSNRILAPVRVKYMIVVTERDEINKYQTTTKRNKAWLVLKFRLDLIFIANNGLIGL